MTDFSDALDALKAEYAVEIAKISNTLRNKKATYILERWYSAATNQQALEDNEVTSYTITGRTITRRNVKEGEMLVGDLEAKLNGLIYGNTNLIDLNRNENAS